MTPEIIILGPTATVAEALAEIRDPDWLVSIAAQVFVVPAAVQAADRHATSASCPLPAPAARAAEHGAAPLPRASEPTIAPGHARPRRRRAARQLQHARRRRVRRSRPPARRGHRRRRARPHAAHRVAPAPPGRRDRDRSSDRRSPIGEAPRAISPRRASGAGFDVHVRLRGVRPVQRVDRPLPRHRPLPRVPDGHHRRLDRPQHRRARRASSSTRGTAASSCSRCVLSLQASYAAPLILLAQNRQERRDRVAGRERPRGRRAHPGRHRVPRPRDRRRPARAGRRGHRRGAARSARHAHQGDRATQRATRPRGRGVDRRVARRAQLGCGTPVNSWSRTPHDSTRRSRSSVSFVESLAVTIPAASAPSQMAPHESGRGGGRRRAHQLGDAGDQTSSPAGVVAAAHLHAQAAGATLLVRWAQHRQPRRQTVATASRTPHADPVGIGKAAMQQQRGRDPAR